MISFIFSDLAGIGLQIIIFELITAVTCFMMFWVSIGTFLVGVGSFAFYYILLTPAGWLYRTLPSFGNLFVTITPLRYIKEVIT